MNYRKFGQTGWEVSEIGLGTWQLGGDWGEVDGSTANAILKSAVDSGVTFFDTADVYGGGKSESILGEFFSDCSVPVRIATKLGRLEGYPDGYSSALFTRCVENSLKRLRCEALDLVQLHCIPEHHLASGEVFEWLRELRQAGKILAFGASVETVGEAFLCLKQPDCASLQIIFNVFRQKPADRLFAAAEENGTALIVRLPLASGLLAGNMKTDTTFVSSDHRNYNRNGDAFSAGETFSGLEYSCGLQCVEKVRGLLPSGLPMAQAALRWVLDHPQVSVVIPGASKTAQVQSNTASSDLAPLSESVHRDLRKLYDEEIDGKIRGRM